ncbi:MAG TPA: chemotaxis protein CheW [Campylobacterales bacterium]|nr:chemotaxis protein CheW [Campylobacterales bacterium]
MQSGLYLTFEIKNEIFAAEVEKVAEIITYQQITELPNTKEWIKGVVNLRGEVAPIIDMRLKFDPARKNLPCNDETVIIAVKTNDERTVGIIVDAVLDVENIADDEIKSAPEIGVSLDAKYLKGLYAKENGGIVILDMDNILAKEELTKAMEFAYSAVSVESKSEAKA